MRYFLAILLMVIFSLQVLPVRKIGRVLSKAQGTEEVQNDDDGLADDGPGSTGFFTGDLLMDHQSFDVVEYKSFVDRKIKAILLQTEALPLVLVARIPSPPPEC